VTATTNSLRATRRALRRELRARRDALPRWRRLALARRIEAEVARLPQLRRGAAVAMYAHFGSEVPTTGLRALALRRGCRLYLPTISNFASYTMDFRRDFGRPLPRNRLGIGEPQGTPVLDVRQLDLLLMPMVGFDAAGFRIGNGAGYYDRLLGARLPERLTASAAARSRRPRPLLVGIAFECQRLQHIDAAAHDVPLDAVISEQGLRYSQRE
jgi:5-formyltetrahydrofolate cyclo-ligase